MVPLALALRNVLPVADDEIYGRSLTALIVATALTAVSIALIPLCLRPLPTPLGPLAARGIQLLSWGSAIATVRSLRAYFIYATQSGAMIGPPIEPAFAAAVAAAVVGLLTAVVIRERPVREGVTLGLSATAPAAVLLVLVISPFVLFFYLPVWALAAAVPAGVGATVAGLVRPRSASNRRLQHGWAQRQYAALVARSYAVALAVQLLFAVVLSLSGSLADTALGYSLGVAVSLIALPVIAAVAAARLAPCRGRRLPAAIAVAGLLCACVWLAPQVLAQAAWFPAVWRPWLAGASGGLLATFALPGDQLEPAPWAALLAVLPSLSAVPLSGAPGYPLGSLLQDTLSFGILFSGTGLLPAALTAVVTALVVRSLRRRRLAGAG